VWRFLLFVGVGLFAPRNAVTVTVLLVTALSVASAIALIDDPGRALSDVWTDVGPPAKLRAWRCLR
jgi:hypothetical protein